MSIKALYQSILTNLGEVRVMAGAVSLQSTHPSGITKDHPYFSLYDTVWDDLANYDAEKHGNIKYVIKRAVEQFERDGSPANKAEPLIQVLTRLDAVIRQFMSNGQLLGTPDRVKPYTSRELSPDAPVRRLFADISTSLDQK